MQTCPRCYGSGEEPGVPVDDRDGIALCLLCQGRGEVTLMEEVEYLSLEYLLMTQD